MMFFYGSQAIDQESDKTSTFQQRQQGFLFIFTGGFNDLKCYRRRIITSYPGVW